MERVGFGVVGVRNFAQDHIKYISKIEEEGLGELRAVVVQEHERGLEIVELLRDRGVRIFSHYQDLLDSGQGLVDIITLPVAIHTHYDMAKRGLEAGYNIILEKPPVPTVQQLDDLMRVERETGKFVAVGFQMIYSRSLRRLKEIILEGRLGEIKEITCRGYWPRTDGYYRRNEWAGKVIVDGQLVLDGPMNNALAHYLNNMLFIAGPDMDSSAGLRFVRAELYRARPYIDSPDTSCLEAETTQGTRLYFYVTHCPEEKFDPLMEVVGTEGTARWRYPEKVDVVYNDGSKERFDSGGTDPFLEVVRTAASVHQGKAARPYSTLENSRSFVVAINGAYDSAQYITPIPEHYVRYVGRGDDRLAVVTGIDELFDKACAERKLLSELNVYWARRTWRVSVEDYRSFNPFRRPHTIQ
ncbi:MAG: Gfo/Idh/MocA family oxidoreductase [Firmicutes bacterium]|nr:Gfo/Idh/MocA family oxidoreductase [Bacillota bacterium]